MNKILKSMLCACVCVFSGLSFAACSPAAQGEDVQLQSVQATDVGSLNDVDYYVVPEPAASLRASTMGLNIVGSLQELYGTNNGYPQAVIVAKKSLLTSNSQLVSNFINAVVANSTWLTAESTSTQTIVSAISSHLPSGTTASLNAKNLTKTVIQNCGINFVDAQTDKSRITTYISSLQQINDTAVGQMADDFFYTAPQTLQSASNTTVSVYMPDGAPALALAQLMAEEMQFGATVSYHVVTSESIAATVTGNNPQADICVLPSNLASKLLGTGATYQLLGTVTNGNLFLLSKSEETITRTNLSVLQGKTVGVVNLAAVPGLTFKLILKNNNLTYADLNA
jgi:hypothetical protein